MLVSFICPPIRTLRAVLYCVSNTRIPKQIVRRRNSSLGFSLLCIEVHGKLTSVFLSSPLPVQASSPIPKQTTNTEPDKPTLAQFDAHAADPLFPCVSERPPAAMTVLH